jgi:alkanesulfonate monooxygenase SsuD/methylene tetrahydromethanopterin reductase-like flavin-dependent oxidoreductase (luciferase family)
LEVYKKALDKLGKPFPDELPIRREVFVARTREEALRICRPYLEDKYKTYHAWGQSKAMPEGDNDLGQELDELLKDRFLIGSPEEVTERLVNLALETGVNHVVMSVQWPGMPQNLVLDTMHLLAEEVFPKVRAALKS